jgi:hypothetical protein
MLISKSEIISLAFISSFDENDIKDEIINTAISKYIIPAVTPAIFQQAVDNPEDYNILISNYINPCLAFYVKYLQLQQLFLESSRFITPEIATVKNNLKETVAEVLIIALQKKADLSQFVVQNYIFTPPSSKKLINGFLI